jgi:putative CocE/NonD family hydrolase
LSTPQASKKTHEITIDRKVDVAMRDGVILRADVYRPVTPGRYPVIVERVAYELDYRVGPYASFFAERGYVFVGQNVRGTYWSEGEHDWSSDGWGELQDGYDTIEWAGTQPWSNGRVGTMDGSQSGFTQYALAPTRPPHLTTMFVRSGVSDPYRDWSGHGGVQPDRRVGHADGLIYVLQHESASAGSEHFIGAIEKAVAEPELIHNHLPLADNPVVSGDEHPSMRWLLEGINHPNYDAYWELLNTRAVLHQANVPIFHISGWFDGLLAAALNSYGIVRERGHSEFARENQRLMVGPWPHAEFAPDGTSAGELEFGPDASIGLNEFRLRWFEHWLREPQAVFYDSPRVRIFVMGENEWEDHDEWPPADVEYTPMYFHQGSGKSDESLNNGAMTWHAPAESEQPDAYDYDPMDPVPGGSSATDIRAIEGRVLTYTSSALEEDLKVVGPLKVTLHASSSATDTDWFVRLCDVWPDGRSIQIQNGQLRARYRNSFESQELMEPGEVYAFEIDLAATANVFKAGHKLRVQVTSSDYPTFGRNLNTGGVNAEETVGVVARNTIFHDSARPSHILLPVIR